MTEPGYLTTGWGGYPEDETMGEHGALTGAERDALDYLYGGGDEEIVCWSARWVVTRYSHKCVSLLHKGPMKQPAGSRMVLERARVEGQFGSCYTCEACMKASAKEIR